MASSGLFAAVMQDFSRKREIPLEAVVLQYRVACPEAEVTLIKFDSLNITFCGYISLIRPGVARSQCWSVAPTVWTLCVHVHTLVATDDKHKPCYCTWKRWQISISKVSGNLSWVFCCSACQVPKGAITLSKLCLEGCQWSGEHGLVEQDAFGKQYYELPDLICYPMEVNTQFWRSWMLVLVCCTHTMKSQ